MKYLPTGIFLLVIIFLGSIVSLFGWYPAGIVHNKVIWRHEVDTIATATITYYKHTLSTPSSTLPITPELTAEVRKQAFETLIDQVLINEAVRRVSTEAEINALIQQKIDTYSAEPEFTVAVSLIYGFDASRFYKNIVKPEAEKELLKEKNKWDDAAFEKWRAEERARARIIRFGEN